MSITLELSQELEKELSIQAGQLGLPLPDYILRVLSNAPVTSSKPKTGAELVEYWEREGLVGTRPDIADSQAHARLLRNQAERRARS